MWLRCRQTVSQWSLTIEVKLQIPDEPNWRGQFLVSKSAYNQERFKTLTALDGWTVNGCEGLETHNIVTSDKRLIGSLIGRPIDHDAVRVIEGETTYSGPGPETLGFEGAFEDFIYRLSGSYLVILSIAQQAAASTGLLLDEDGYIEQFDDDLFDALGIMGEGWFPSGLTAHKGIKRLLCNHYLDLNDFECRRHWPKADIAANVSATDAALRIAEISRRATEALISSGRTVSTLTGGNESRFLLAACRQQIGDMDFVTVAGRGTARDVYLAKRLAEKAGMTHTLLPIVEASETEMERWIYAAGHCISGSNMRSHPSIRQLQSYNAFVGGLGGEIGRAFFWRKGDSEHMQLTPQQVVPRFGMPGHDTVLAATEQWFASIEEFNPLLQLDLAYLELRMSAWAFAQCYAQDAIVPHIHPMIGRESFELMLGLSPEAKRDNSFILEGVRELWPERLDIPINEYGDYRDFLRVISVSTDPVKLVRSLRKRFG